VAITSEIELAKNTSIVKRREKVGAKKVIYSNWICRKVIISIDKLYAQHG
jgi:hypothetical protein